MPTMTTTHPDWTKRHRPPYRLVAQRPMATKPGFSRTAWLPGTSDAESVEPEARALLDDPRDTIIRVDVWSVRQQRFVMTYSREMNR